MPPGGVGEGRADCGVGDGPRDDRTRFFLGVRPSLPLSPTSAFCNAVISIVALFFELSGKGTAVVVP